MGENHLSPNTAKSQHPNCWQMPTTRQLKTQNQTPSAELKAKSVKWPQVVSGLADIRDEIFLEDQKL